MLRYFLRRVSVLFGIEGCRFRGARLYRRKSRAQFVVANRAILTLPRHMPIPQFSYQLPEKGDWSVAGPKCKILRLIDSPIRLDGAPTTIEYLFVRASGWLR
jgi:hypothetical protein